MNFRQPAEWGQHSACWTAWPCHAHLWKEDLTPAQDAFVEMCRVITNRGEVGSERLKILTIPSARDEAARRLNLFHPELINIPYGDIWLRDTGPVFTVSEFGVLRANCFAFNGWGGKFNLPHDRRVAARVARCAARHADDRSIVRKHSWVFEGGSLDVNGLGTGLTTHQCLLNKNRNPHLTKKEVEANVRHALGVEKLLWITRGLVNDHTDGHVDNIARFVAPRTVLCMESRSASDPNRDVLIKIRRELQSFRDADGHRLNVLSIPSPGRVEDPDGRVMPASYLNFYIANTAVVVPIFGARYDDRALRGVEECFPSDRVVGVNARALLSGGGAFHCITQQQP